MDNNFPALDFDRSPYTGWTRAHWEYILARMTYGYAKIAEQSGIPGSRAYIPMIDAACPIRSMPSNRLHASPLPGARGCAIQLIRR